MIGKKAGHNEPDNMRSFDRDPRSPYFVEAPIDCHECHHSFDSDDGFHCEIEGVESPDFCSLECAAKFESDYTGEE